jgi:hypothetical protein
MDLPEVAPQHRSACIRVDELYGAASTQRAAAIVT